MQTAYDDEVCFRAVERIRELAQRPDRHPFFLAVSFTNPHDPWEVRARHWDIYADRAIDPPAVAPIPRAQADPHSLRLRDMSGIDDHPLTAAQVMHGRRAYYAAISYLDERVGEVLAALRAHGFGDDTVVAFTADHGEMGGERGLWFKMSLFDGSARVPLVLAGPGVPQGRVPAPVSHLDLAPTLADLAGIGPGDSEFEGASLDAGAHGDRAGRSGDLRVPGRGRDRARGDGAPRPLQADPLSGRPRPALRPACRSARACESRRRCRPMPARMPPWGPSATRAGTWRRCGSGCCAARPVAAV